MYQERNVLILILSILSLAYNQAQDTYIKQFKIYDDRFPVANVLVIDEESIYIESRGDCNGDACGHVSKLDLFGNSLFDIPFEGLYGGNSNNLILDEENLYYATYSYPIQRYNFIKIVKSAGEIKVKKYFALDTISVDRMNVESYLKTDTGFLISGEFVNKNGIASGIIQWIDNDFNPVRNTTYNLPNNFNVNAIQDLQPDGYGNLVFATVLRTPGKDDTLVIRKIDNIGNAIKDIKIPSNTSIHPRPQFAVTNKGNYVFSHENSAQVRIYQLVCADTSGNILWTHDYPTKPIDVPTSKFHTYSINQITPTSDDGVIITATIKSNEFGGYRDAYIGKFDYKGQLEWERKINFLDDRDSLYDQCYLYDIKERPDGKGYIAVGTYTPSDTFTISILLVSLDRDGCIEELECDDGRIIVGTADESIVMDHKNKVSIFPNPVIDRLRVEISDLVKGARIIITDLTGKKLVNQEIYHSTDIETSEWSSGLYIVTLTDKYGTSKSYKLVKQ